MNPDIAVAVLAALGHGIRLEIWRMLAPYGPLGLPAGSIAAQLAIAPSSLSFHLQQLTQAQVLLHRRSSRQIIYAVNHDVMDSLCVFLTTAAGQMIHLSPNGLSSLHPGDVISE